MIQPEKCIMVLIDYDDNQKLKYFRGIWAHASVFFKQGFRLLQFKNWNFDSLLLSNNSYHIKK